MRLCGIAIFAALTGLLAVGAPACLRAQTVQSAQAATPVDNRILADSAPYTIEWNGTSGVFVRKAFGQEREVRQPMTYLHSDAGPTGFAKHLAWFLARDPQGFSVLWCYLNASGSEFDCWLYRFPSNQLTSLHFTGSYQFIPPAEPAPANPMAAFKLANLPSYVGPTFVYRNWTRTVGALASLELKTTKLQGAPPGAGDTSPVAKTLTQLRVRPLHQVEVGSANGWREGGWHELHALAFDAAEDPYYFILYSNTPNGYVVDLKRAQIYTADFGSKVSFPDAPQFGPSDNPLNTLPEIKVHRYDRHEIVLTTREKAANPYVDLQVGVEFRGPDAKPVLVPGFWDGGGTFRVRFVPTLRGTWRWRSLSKVADLDGQTGAFECVGEEPGVKGFVNVQPLHRDTRHFAYADGDPFLPVFVREPAPPYAVMSAQERSATATRPTVQLAGLGSAAQDETASFVAYQRFIDAAAQKGFNRLAGGVFLGPAAGKLVRSNEGGPAIAGPDLDKVNPAFFQWMDRRIAYCNARGIVPDIGISTLEDALFSTYKPEALYRFWAYVVARYASFDVQWNLFDVGESAPSAATNKGAEQFAELTRLYDPYHHPITFVTPGPTAVSMPAAQATDTPRSSRDTDTGGRPSRGRRGARGGLPSNGAGANMDSTPSGARPGSGAPPAGGALAGAAPTPRQAVPYDVPWQDVITVLGGDVNALPYYASLKKPLVMLERPVVNKEAALDPEVARHRMWEARMRGVYWSPGQVPAADPSALNAPEIQWAAYCADLFRRTRFYRLAPRPDMLGGPAESAADRRRRKKAEAAAAAANPAPPRDNSVPPLDFDPFDPDSFGPEPLPVPKPTPMFVLADPAREYVVYFEQGGTLLLDLLEATGKVQTTWFNPRTGVFSPTKQIIGGAYTSFTAPDSNDWVLYIARL